jgi:hypothetical protein
MFDANIMKNFYHPSYENDEKVCFAWYKYVLKFLPLVSKQWRRHVSNDNLKHQKSMFLSITISDEALVRWFIVLWIPIIESNKNNEWKVKDKSSGRGPHDTKRNIDLYTVIREEVGCARKDHHTAARWNDIFWNEVKKRNSELFLKRAELNYAPSDGRFCRLPLPDLDEDQEFLANFTNDYDAATALVSMSPSKNDNQAIKSIGV